MTPAWWPAWEGETCVIVASGPSAGGVPLEQAKGSARFVAVNASVKLCPWADIVYAHDLRWWESVDGLPDFGGLKLSGQRAVPEWGIRKVEVARGDDRIMLGRKGRVGWGRSSGFQAFNLAVQFGCNPIVLVGFDATLANGSHWHGDHPAGLHNPRPDGAARWRATMDNASKAVAAMGIEVINSSETSALRQYRTVPFKEVFPC